MNSARVLFLLKCVATTLVVCISMSMLAKSFHQEDKIWVAGRNIRQYVDTLNNPVQELGFNCENKELTQRIEQRGDYWVLYNYIRASRRYKCHESVTYTTHTDYTFMDNLVPLLKSWQGPISLSVYAPGSDFHKTMDTIAYLRECTDGLVKEYVTFHVYFPKDHMPTERLIPNFKQASQMKYNCSKPAPYDVLNTTETYRSQKELLYPVNVGRNIARVNVQTHFVLQSDIELYPNPGLIKEFLHMIAERSDLLSETEPKVFPLHIFEVNADQEIPLNKTRLKEMLAHKKAIPFHKSMCAVCHRIPRAKEWIQANQTSKLGIFVVGKRQGDYHHWEPIYIGTNAEPLYDERLTWEGRSDKMTQGYVLCLLDYQFHILDNAFLVHKPGVKKYKKNKRRDAITGKQSYYIKNVILKEINGLYGKNKNCVF